MTPAILRPNRNVWRIEKAARAAVLIDGAAFFRAVREAFLQARRSIFVVGWDIDSRTRLVGESNEPGDPYPETLAEFLCELVRERPELRVNLLLWDYSILYASEREMFPRLSLQWKTPEQITLCLDDTVPFGCSQHQKIIVVDDALAFSGGLDLTIRRWDTSEHAAHSDGRLDPAGQPYRPFHDVQMAVDGAAARALAEMAHERWTRAMACQAVPYQPSGNPWPASVPPDFTDVDVGISRTLPACESIPEVREAEALFLDSIDAAKRTIYIENQYVTSAPIAERLAKQLRDRPGLEVVIVAPRSYDSWVEQKAMRNSRIHFWQQVREAGGERVRLLYPSVSDGKHSTHTMIHSKVTVIDDRFLRIGSANINNRSMGTDTECDLAIEARNESERRAIIEIRNRLVGDHCGVEAADVARAMAQTGSLVAVVDRLSGNGHSLRPIDDGEPDDSELAPFIRDVGDPKRPLSFGALLSKWRRRWGPLRERAALVAIGVLLMIIGLTLAWQYTPLADYADPREIADLLNDTAVHPWASIFVVGIFVLAGLVAFPVIILIAATAAAFGPWLGFAYALAGVLASALVSYAIGARFGQETLRGLLGPRLERIRRQIERRGVLAVATVRVVPVAPFTVINLVAGASSIRLVDYIIGTLLGMLPGLIVISALGYQILRMLSDPSLTELALLALAILVWIGVSFGVQALVSRLWSTAS
jgi:phospholipase D1/2